MLEYQESVQPTDISRWSWQPGSVSATSQGGLQFTAQLRPPKKDSWGSVKPPSYATWSCRETPWRDAGPRRPPRRARTDAKVDAKVDVRWRKRTETPSTRCPSRAVQPSPQLRTPSPDAFVVSKAPSPAPMDVIQSPSKRLGPSQWSWLLTHQGDRDCMASLMSDASCVLAERYSEPSAVLQDPADEHSARHAETMEGLRVASMVMGEKARGPVTLGIRVKAVQRLAVASALRQLVHLPAGRQQEEEEMEGDSAAISPSSPRSLYSMETDNTPPPSESSEEEEAPPAQDSLAAMLSSAAKSCKLSSKIQQTRFREVLANTTLGKMVKAHPEKAAKFGLAVVPKWSHKPWPPPPVVAHFSSQPSAWALRLLQKTEDRKKKEEEGARRRMSTNMERRFTRKMSRAQTDGEERMSPDSVIISDLASAVTSQRKRTPRTSMFKGQGASMRRYSRPEEEERLQDILDHAVTIIKMNIPEKDAIINCFLKHSLSTTPSHLSSQALLRGFAEMEIQPKTFREKQTMKEVQELVIKKYRKEDKNFEVDGIKNPLKHKRGGWLFEEFLAMTATYKQIAREEQEEVDQALASQNSCELAVIREFRKVYNESRTQEQMIVKDVLAILSKVGIRNPSDKELALLLNLQLGANMELSRFRRITFADFIPAMLKIQGMLAQVAGDPEEES